MSCGDGQVAVTNTPIDRQQRLTFSSWLDAAVASTRSCSKVWQISCLLEVNLRSVGQFRPALSTAGAFSEGLNRRKDVCLGQCAKVQACDLGDVPDRHLISAVRAERRRIAARERLVAGLVEIEIRELRALIEDEAGSM